MIGNLDVYGFVFGVEDVVWQFFGVFENEGVIVWCCCFEQVVLGVVDMGEMSDFGEIVDYQC